MITTGQPDRKPVPRVLTEEERESSGRSSSWYNGTRMAEGRTDRAGALEQRHATIVGFLTERYEAELDEAVSRSDALIEEGIRRGTGSWQDESNMAHLRAAHPGSNGRAPGRALGWGHLIHR